MSSNKDLLTSIGEEAVKKGVDVPDTNDQNNAQLSETLKGLRALEMPVTTAEAEAQATAEAEAQATAEAEADTVPPYTIAEGKSITCKKGTLDSGDEVKAEYLSGGEETLADLIDRKLVVEN